MRALLYWTCDRHGDVILDYYMPQSGKKCNLHGCGGTREARIETVSDEVYERYQVAKALWKSDDFTDLAPAMIHEWWVQDTLLGVEPRTPRL